jgi:GDP-L-fucose synthase
MSSNLDKLKSFYEEKKVLVTGGTGLIGSHLVELLLSLGAYVRLLVHSRPPPIEIGDHVEIIRGDLTRWNSCIKAVKEMDFVFHLAAVVGGVGRNAAYPASMFTPNILINTQMLEAARLADVERYLYTSSACIYPADLELFVEEKGWDGPPEPTNASYGWVKRMGELQAQAYHIEYGMKIAIVRPTNAYGPRDNFDLETSHVIPALIRKAIERHDPFVIWGTGESTRDFIHARDIARGMILTLMKYSVADPINLATGRSIKIKDLAYLILRLANYENARVVFDKSRPTGQLIRRVSTVKAKEKIGFVAKISLEEGLRETIMWYKKYRSSKNL